MPEINVSLIVCLIQIDAREVMACRATDLHKALDISGEFDAWFKRHLNSGFFTVDKHYIWNSEQGYVLSLDMAKSIASTVKTQQAPAVWQFLADYGNTPDNLPVIDSSEGSPDLIGAGQRAEIAKLISIAASNCIFMSSGIPKITNYIKALFGVRRIEHMTRRQANLAIKELNHVVCDFEEHKRDMLVLESRYIAERLLKEKDKIPAEMLYEPR